MKLFIKILLALCLLVSMYSVHAVVDFGKLDKANKITDVSITANVDGKNTIDVIENAGYSMLTSVKLILQGVMIIFIVYLGIQMIISMGTDEDALTKSKQQLWYTLVGILFLNIPGTLYNAFNSDTYGQIDGRIGQSQFVKTPGNSDTNLFIDIFDFGYTLNNNIIGFIEVIISAIAIFMILLAGLNMILSKGKEEELTNAKDKILWSIVGLIFVGFIELWKFFAFKGEIKDGVNIFETGAELALFFAGPIAIVFLTLAGYYYVTANGEEEQIKKAKSIVMNTLLATVILLASYTFLLDLATL